MAITVRKLSESLARAGVIAHNNSMHAITAALTSYPHADASARTSGDFISPVVTVLASVAPSATDLPTTLVLTNELKLVFNEHIADGGAHSTADDTNTVSTDAATDQTTANTLLNDIKTAFNAHLTESGVHSTDDTTNAVSTADATDLGTSEALANALQSALNAHIIFALGDGGCIINQVTA